MSDIEPDRPQTFKNISLYPLVSPDGGRDVDYQLFTGDIDMKNVRIYANRDDGDVPDLTIDNRGHHRYLILDGDELQAEQEAYIARVSAMIPTTESVVLPVHNLEFGRWVHESETIRNSARTHFPKRQPRETNDGRATQHGLNPESRTLKVTTGKDPKSLSAAKDKTESEFIVQNKSKLQDYLDELVILPSQVGVVFVVNSEVVGAELYENEVIFASVLLQLLDCYATEDILIRPPISNRASDKAVADFMSGIKESNLVQCSTPGEGADLRFDDKTLTGGALVVNDRIVHLCALPTSTIVNTAGFRGRRERMRSRMH